MSKKTIVRKILIVLPIILFFGWRVYLFYQYDVPVNFAYKTISIKDMHGEKTYRNEYFGFEITYPDNYYLVHTSDFSDTSSFGYISLRQNTSSEEDAKTLGKRIGLYVYRLGQIPGISVGGYPVKLTRETTVLDIAQQFLADDNRPLVQRNCYQRDVNGINTIICIKRAPGERPLLTSGIFEVFILGIYEMENGDRILVKMSNNTGGTPYTRDRALRRDVLRVFYTLRRE